VSILTWPLRLVRFAGFFLWQLVASNVRLAREVATPGLRIDVAITRVPTRCRSPLELVLLANAISLTPGTITLEADEDAMVLYVHGMFAPDRESFLASMARMEDELLRAARPRGDREGRR
jgi:multicomponent Na+:H+ antiporter subunit E